VAWAAMALVDMCRLCGTDTFNIVRNAIFEGEGRSKKYALKILECLTLQVKRGVPCLIMLLIDFRVQVREEDQLPKLVCGECSYKLELMSDFRVKAFQTETQLHCKIHADNIKTEVIVAKFK
jgi:KRAB domain-containing zinc finger protein